MSSPFFSELTKLDSSLRTIQLQVDRLRSGSGDDEDQLKQSIAEASQHASVLRELIRAENADAKWNDREALEQVILALEIAADDRRDQQRRTRLLELASELEAGSVKHRSSARAAALEALRLKAVTQLRELAARKEQEKELAGPPASDWVRWVCNLQEENDAATLAELRQNFSALDEFAASIEESFWVPGERAAATLPPVQTSVQTTESPRAPVEKLQAPSRSSADRLPQEVKARFEKAVRTGDLRDGLSLCYDLPANEPGSTSEAKTLEPRQADLAGKNSPSTSEATSPLLKYCEQCGRTYPNRYKVCPFDSAALQDLPETAPEASNAADTYPLPPAVLRVKRDASPSKSSAGDAKGSAAELAPEATPERSHDESIPVPEFGSSSSNFGELTLSKRPPIATWVAAAILVILCAVFGWMHLRGASSAKAESSVANAATNPDASAPKPLLHRLPAEGAQNNVLLSLENCERTNPAGIECWGYISNQRDKDSKVSLFRADVVDGKGNSFDLNTKGSPNFAPTHDFTVPAQSKVKYSITVPDNDKDARTLTLYLDVNNPRSSEYTFRDVPVSD